MLRITKLGNLFDTDTKTIQINGVILPVIAATEDGIPLVDIHMMSEEDEMRAARRCREAHPEEYALYDQMVRDGHPERFFEQL